MSQICEVRQRILPCLMTIDIFFRIGACLVLLGTAPKSEDLIPLGGTNGSDYPLIDLSLFDAPFVVLSPYNDIFFAVVTSSTFVMVFSGVVLPTLGGDQVSQTAFIFHLQHNQKSYSKFESIALDSNIQLE